MRQYLVILKSAGNQLLVFLENQEVKMAYAIRPFGLCRMMKWQKPNGRVSYAPEKIRFSCEEFI